MSFQPIVARADSPISASSSKLAISYLTNSNPEPALEQSISMDTEAQRTTGAPLIKVEPAEPVIGADDHATNPEAVHLVETLLAKFEQAVVDHSTPIKTETPIAAALPPMDELSVTAMTLEKQILVDTQDLIEQNHYTAKGEAVTMIASSDQESSETEGDLESVAKRRCSGLKAPKRKSNHLITRGEKVEARITRSSAARSK
ncbi:hypothetical protein HYALB_00010034 [Hymenoscyphus albidus]|uniref:Uncharacterized protein n=1 Tax=Hymenoscyphus albidus TaxID=595503 RepID=A0A9N9LPP2_9HELO|nr:hypothetical protein HYALB_00010034 [Hymenoscyphus albidus]